MTTTNSRRLARAVAVPAAAAIALGAAATTTGLLGSTHATAATCATLVASPTHFTSAGEQCFTVPAGVTSIHAVLIGGTGGDGFAGYNSGAVGTGGHGAEVTADVAVTPGEIVYVEVAGNGANGHGSLCAAGLKPTVASELNASGYNGGAVGGSNECTGTAGQGGGETDLRTVQADSTPGVCPDSSSQYAAGTASLASRILVAGGGGGGGNPDASGTNAGGNGGTAGATPSSNQNGSGGFEGGGGGKAGGSTDGGAGGSAAGLFGHAGSAGGVTQPCGGQGGTPSDFNNGGGGGGGGYFGGGGGGTGWVIPITSAGRGASGVQLMSAVQSVAVAASGGGGGGGGAGSSYAKPGVTSAVTVAPDAPTPPGATISFTVATPTPTSSVQAITTPAVGAASPGLDLGVGILGAGVSVLGALAIGWRRSRSDGHPTTPA